MNLEISINTLELIQVEKLNIELFVILLAIYKEDNEFMETFSQNMKSISAGIVLQRLFRQGYIVISNKTNESIYELTEKGLNFIKLTENQNETK